MEKKNYINTSDSFIINGELDNLDTEISNNYLVFPLWFSILIIVISTIIVLLNILHLTIILRMPSLKRPTQQNYKLFLIGLALVDIVTTFCNGALSPPAVQEYMKTSRILCIAPAVILHSAYINMGSLTFLIAVDRVLSIRLGIKYRQHWFITSFRHIAGAAAFVIFSGYIAVAIVFRNKGYEPKGNGPCKMGTKQAPFLDFITSILLYLVLTALLVIYVIFICFVKRYLLSKTGRNIRESKEIAQVVGVIILCHLVSWMPPLVNLVLRAVGIKITAMEYVNIMSMLLNSTANPLIYGVSSPTYRRGLKCTLSLHKGVGSAMPPKPSAGSSYIISSNPSTDTNSTFSSATKLAP